MNIRSISTDRGHWQTALFYWKLWKSVLRSTNATTGIIIQNIYEHQSENKLAPYSVLQEKPTADCLQPELCDIFTSRTYVLWKNFVISRFASQHAHIHNPLSLLLTLMSWSTHDCVVRFLAVRSSYEICIAFKVPVVSHAWWVMCGFLLRHAQFFSSLRDSKQMTDSISWDV